MSDVNVISFGWYRWSYDFKSSLPMPSLVDIFIIYDFEHEWYSYSNIWSALMRTQMKGRLSLFIYCFYFFVFVLFSTTKWMNRCGYRKKKKSNESVSSLCFEVQLKIYRKINTFLCLRFIRFCTHLPPSPFVTMAAFTP